MKVSQKDINEKYVNVWTTRKVKELMDKEDKGVKLHLNEKIWFDNKVGVRKAGIKFAMTTKEIEEYTKCKLDIQYFAETFCQIKREDGTVGPMTLRDYQKDIIDLFQNKRSILMASRQTGKAQDLNSVVWDENGKKRFGDLKIGDKIYGDDGELTNVIGIYPKGKKDIYEVEFSDGLKVKCCDEHLWEVEKYGKTKVVELSEIMKKYRDGRGDYMYYVKVAEPVNYPEKNLKIDPYFMGLILGDGSTRNNRLTISSKDKEIINYLNTLNDDDIKIKHIDRKDQLSYDYGIRKKNNKPHKYISLLKEMNLMEKYSYEKHIPEEYLYGSIEQRLSLLQGLMDTDGYIQKNQPCYCTSSSELCDNVRELCHSLGIKTQIRTKFPTYTYKGIKKNGRKTYIIRLLLKNGYKYPIFRLKRKQSKIKNKKYDWGQKRGIKNIKYVEKLESQCIEVDNENHLYLTDHYIPTHNTVSAAITILHFVLFNKDKGAMVVANKGATVVEIIEKIKNIYKLLPFFLKRGIVNWNQSSITLDNGCRIKTDKRTKEPAIGFTIDLLYLDEFAHIPGNFIEPYYTAVIPILSSIDDSRLIITSTPKGLNLFHKLLTESEFPEDDPNWNGFKSMRVYWWQIKGRRDTKLFLMDKNLRKHGVNKGDVKDFFDKMGLETYDKKEDGVIGIFIKYKKNDERTQYDHIAQLRINNIPLGELGRLTNWEKQETKFIGGEDGFKQEYDLHFLTGNKMLFDSVLIEEIYEQQLKFDYYEIPRFEEKLNIPYGGLQFIKNKPSVFNMAEIKNYHIFMGVDLSEGLGEDYSVINIFRLVPKTTEEIEKYKSKFVDIYDYFKMEQIGIFKTNIYSVEEVANILYMLSFELFNPDNVRIALERNTYGDALLAHIPNVFNQENEYSNHVFLRYKSRQEEKKTRMGLRVNRNKKLLIKDYQVNTRKGNLILHDKYTIQEVTTFTKQDTPSGDVTFKSESGHDDAIMSCIVLSSAFSHIAYRDMIDNLIDFLGGELSDIIKEKKTQFQEDAPDLSTFAGGYSKIYKNNNNTPGLPYIKPGAGNFPSRGGIKPKYPPISNPFSTKFQ